MKTIKKITGGFSRFVLVPMLGLAILVTGCAPNKEIVKDQNAVQEAAKTIENTEKKIEELKKLPENEKIVKKMTEELSSAKKALDRGDPTKALEMSKKVDEQASENLKKQELKEKAAAQLREAEGVYESAIKAGAGTNFKDMMKMAEADIEKAKIHLKTDEYIDSIKYSLSSIATSKAALEMCKTVPWKMYMVIRGDCLWNISKKKDIYNDPFLWPLIYKDNMDIIKNPNMIYPKQEFKIQISPAEENKKKAIKEAWFGLNLQ